MNMVRSDPKKYAEMYILPMLKNFDGNIYIVPGRTNLRTKEGASAVRECVSALSKAQSAGILTPEKGLSLAAKDHAADTGPAGQTGHTGTNGSTLVDRTNKHGKRQGSSSVGENISYGYNVAREIVIQLLVDDGVPSRGHRENIMNGRFTQAGTSIAPHKVYKNMCVVVYANNYFTTSSK
jgi:uncharacterized protein YkwD